MQPALYQSLAHYNVWMNDKVYAAAAQLSDEERKASRGAYFSSIHGTLNHLLFGDRAWLGRFTGKAYPLAPIGEDICSDFVELNAARKAIEQEIITFCDGLSADTLAEDMTWHSISDDTTRTQPRWLLVTHMFNHQIHHRGQVTTLLSQAGQHISRTDIPWMPGA